MYLSRVSTTIVLYDPIGRMDQLTRKLILPPVRYDFAQIIHEGRTQRVELFTCTASISDLTITSM